MPYSTAGFTPPSSGRSYNFNSEAPLLLVFAVICVILKSIFKGYDIATFLPDPKGPLLTDSTVLC